MSTLALDAAGRTAVSFWIAKQEMRTDSAGNPVVYKLDPDDGGGKYEVAGFNDRYHPALAAEMAALVYAQRYNDVWRRVTEELAAYTDAVTRWGITLTAGEECYLRDCVFNRGPGGAAKILQTALLVDADGKIGPQTRAAYTARPAAGFLERLRLARELYEWRVAGYRAKYWPGLVNRWNNALAYSRSV